MGVEAPQPSGGTIDAADLTALAARERLANGSLRAAELTEACLGRIAVREPEVQAWACVDADLAVNIPLVGFGGELYSAALAFDGEGFFRLVARPTPSATSSEAGSSGDPQR